MSVNDNGDEQIFDIHCVSEETDIFRNGGIEDITRLIVDESKLNGSDVNVIVKGKRKRRKVIGIRCVIVL